MHKISLATASKKYIPHIQGTTMKDDDRATMANRIDDAANPSDGKEWPGKLEEPAGKRQGEKRSGGERRYSHSTGAKKPERRISARRASDKGTSDIGNADKE